MFKEFPLVKQRELSDCGPSSLLMVLKYYGGDYPLEELKRLSHTDKNGTSAYLLKEAAREVGLDAEVVKGDIKNLNTKDLPIIAHIKYQNNFEHFLVIYKIDKAKDYLLIADPARGKRAISKVEFEKISTSYFIKLYPSKNLAKIKTSKEIKTTILNYFLNNKKVIISISLLSILFGISAAILSYSLKFLVDNVYNLKSINNLGIFIYFYLSLKTLEVISDYLRIYFLNIFSKDLDSYLINKVFNHLLYFPYLYYKDKETGDIINRLNDLINLKNNLVNLILSGFIDSFFIFISFIFLAKINSFLALLTFSLMLFYFLLSFLFAPLYEMTIRREKKKASKVNSFLFNNLSHMETVKNNHLENYVSYKFNNIYKEYSSSSYYLLNLINKNNLIKSLINGFFYLLIYYLASKLLINDKLSLTLFLSFLSLLALTLNPIDKISNIFLVIKEYKISLKRINELYDIKEENLKPNYKYQKDLIKGDIEFKNVGFSYNNLKPVFSKLNLNIREGSKILINGETGSGKSTLVKMLLGYYKPDKGDIFINRININDYSLANLRESISYISQNESIFKDTIYNNIVLDSNISYENFLKIAKICKVDEIIKDNRFRYDMTLVEDGFNLSGGEKSRIYLARALARNTNIYIIDETLANIDIEKEKEILKEVFKIYKEKTFIVISHRKTNKTLYDNIYRFGDL